MAKTEEICHNYGNAAPGFGPQRGAPNHSLWIQQRRANVHSIPLRR